MNAGFPESLSDGFNRLLLKPRHTRPDLCSRLGVRCQKTHSDEEWEVFLFMPPLVHLVQMWSTTKKWGSRREIKFFGSWFEHSHMVSIWASVGLMQYLSTNKLDLTEFYLPVCKNMSSSWFKICLKCSIYMYIEDLVLNNPPWLIRHKNQPSNHFWDQYLF